MEHICEWVESIEQPVLSIRTHARVEELPQLIGKSYEAIMQVMNEKGIYPSGEPYVAYFNLDMKNLDVEMGFPVATAGEGKGDVKPGVIPGGRKAATLYVGPYPEMTSAYEALTTFVEEQGYKPTGVAYEHYLTGPDTPPAEHKTRIVFPIK